MEPPSQLPPDATCQPAPSGGSHTGDKPRGGLRLRLSSFLVFVLCAFGLLLAGPLAWYNYSRSTEAALEVASETMGRAANDVSLRTRLLALPFAFLTEHIPALPGAAAAPRGFEHPLLPALVGIMADTPQMYSAFFGYPDGGFLQVIAVAGNPGVAAWLKAPEGTRLALRAISAQPGGARLERWRYLDGSQAILGETAPAPADYDPRTRPWYALAQGAAHTVRTDLYMFSSTHDLGLTLARRIGPPGKPGPVFGLDLTLPALSGFLREASLGLGGLAFLFDQQGKVVGHPDTTKLSGARQEAGGNGGRNGDKEGLVRVEHLGDPVATAAHQAFVDAGRAPVPLRRMRVAGTDYLLEVRRMEDLGGGGDYLALAARVEDFTGAVARTRNHTLLFTLGLSLALIPLAAWGAQRLARKLELLALEADRIRSLDLDSTAQLHSRIDEMERLAGAVSGMRSAIKSFSRYLPRALVKQFIDTGVDPVPGGERREITLLFTDVENFTPLAEHLPPEELMAAMGEYFETIGKVILDCGGTIDKYIGDAVMAFWNAPFESEGHVEQACLAALRLSRASEELNRRRQAAGLPLLRTRVGVHTGAAVVGNVGASDRMDYTALGATVNLASRLEGLNKFYATSILVSRTVRERAKNAFLFRSVDAVVPKGASDPLLVFELVGAMPQSPHQDVAAPRARLAFCSRWERAVTLYRTAQWDRALAEFDALAAEAPEDRLANMYRTRARRLLENKPGRDWKAVKRYMRK